MSTLVKCPDCGEVISEEVFHHCGMMIEELRDKSKAEISESLTEFLPNETMNKLLIKREIDSDYLVLWEFEEFSTYHTKGTVFPVEIYEDNKYYFLDKNRDTTSVITHLVEPFFSFTFCYRGVWEGRIYPKQEEYWSEDFVLISELINSYEKQLAKIIENNNKDEMVLFVEYI